MITGNLHFGMPWEAYKQSSIIPLMAKKLLPQSNISDSPPVLARVNHGRWVIDCECNGAVLAFDEGIFMCGSCFNAGHKHQYRRHVFPRSRKTIELALLQRPEINRNWYHNESVSKLKVDNEAHKAELLGVN